MMMGLQNKKRICFYVVGKKKAKCKADGRGVLGEGVSKEDFVIDENERSYLQSLWKTDGPLKCCEGLGDDKNWLKQCVDGVSIVTDEEKAKFLEMLVSDKEFLVSQPTS